uniref:Uncharacterized protein n=1 Tax=Megaselia scalaris TaxID=36166 RepID=T1GUV6_MEGSC
MENILDEHIRGRLIDSRLYTPVFYYETNILKHENPEMNPLINVDNKKVNKVLVSHIICRPTWGQHRYSIESILMDYVGVQWDHDLLNSDQNKVTLQEEDSLEEVEILLELFKAATI